MIRFLFSFTHICHLFCTFSTVFVPMTLVSTSIKITPLVGVCEGRAWFIDQLVVLMMWIGGDGIGFRGIVGHDWSASYAGALTGELVTL